MMVGPGVLDDAAIDDHDATVARRARSTPDRATPLLGAPVERTAATSSARSR